MKIRESASLYASDYLATTLISGLTKFSHKPIYMKGLCGSLSAFILSIVWKTVHGKQIIICNDPEEASYLFTDLKNLCTSQNLLFFPSPYKRAFAIEHIENANILLRSEVLNFIQDDSQPDWMIVTHPDAIVEKVVDKSNLRKHSMQLKVGDQIDLAFLNEFLQEFHFERTNFVAEAGQFSIRGGIMDIFSFSSELPFRIEFEGNNVASIRSFDTASQLSVDKVLSMQIVPDMKLITDKNSYQSLLSFLPDKCNLWFKDFDYTREIVGEYEKLNHTNRPVISSKEFVKGTKLHKIIHLNYKAEVTDNLFAFDSIPQPLFHKDFNHIAESIRENTHKGYTNLIFSDSEKQKNRLNAIFEEIAPDLNYKTIHGSISAGFIDHNRKLACYTDHQLFDRYFAAKSSSRFSMSKAMTLKELRDLKPGDFVTHTDHGIGKFAGLEKLETNGKSQESIRLVYKNDDLLYVSIYALHKIARYSGQEGKTPQLSKLGSPEWERKKSNTKKRVRDIARDLILLYAKRKAKPGYCFSEDNYLQTELESSFMYEDTPDQTTATADVKADMERHFPMDRLICGDVGFGKTEVAIRAAFKAVCDSKQVAILVPTTILALQHFEAFSERLKNFPCSVDYINRFKSTANIKKTLKAMKEGKIDILIGTHRLLSKDVAFKSLGLIVVDEEQKFGVTAKEKLKQFRINTDMLTLTATPIPRTLQFSLMGARDLSIISTPPANRQPIETILHLYEDERIQKAINLELERDGQVFFVHNRIRDITEIAGRIQRLCPHARIAIAHGQMDGQKLERIMVKFFHGEYDVLVSTSIIESGLDVPNANTIIIHNAHHFGLSDLHQMRGRVGRSNKKAYCYLLTPSLSTLTSEARKRLSALEEFSYLGAGFNIAMRDLDIRGAGNMLGAEQSGFISEIGFDMYNKILDEAIRELKEEEFKDLFKDVTPAKPLVETDCAIETDMEILIPGNYVVDSTERLSLYSELAKIKEEIMLEKFKANLMDRFGPLPQPVRDLLTLVRLRWLANGLGFEKLFLKNEQMRGYFISNPKSPFYESERFTAILQYVQQYPAGCKLKEEKSILTLNFENIDNIEKAFTVLNRLSLGKEQSFSMINLD